MIDSKIMYNRAMPESLETEESVAKAYRPVQPERAAQHKFLMLGVILAAIIGGALIWLNGYVREETKFREMLDIAVRSKGRIITSATIPVSAPDRGLAYTPARPQQQPTAPNPATIAPDAPTTSAPSAE